MTSNNVVVGLTITDDLEGAGLRTGSSNKMASTEVGLNGSQIAHIVLEGGGERGREGESNVGGTDNVRELARVRWRVGGEGEGVTPDCSKSVQSPVHDE